MRLRVVNIKWDTDGEDVCLPNEIEIPEIFGDDEWAIGDYISDITGFCHSGFDLIESITIRDLAYQLYIIDWKRSNITPEIEMDTWKNYFEETSNYIDGYTFEEFLYEQGYTSGTLYVCYEEFLNAEYLDEEYMKELLDNEKLYNLYLKDLEDNIYRLKGINYEDITRHENKN